MTSMWVRLCLHVARTPTHVRGDSVFVKLKMCIRTCSWIISLMIDESDMSNLQGTWLVGI